MTGDAEITQAALVDFYHQVFDLVAPYFSVNIIYITRAPLPVTSLENITRQFSATVWIMSLVSISALSLMLYVTYVVYNGGHMKAFELARVEKLRTNFLIFPFAKITEPDPLPWFKKWSTGKLLVLLWSLLSLLLTQFYTSNFRASLVVVTHEDPPTRLEDVLKRGETVYNFDLAVDLRCYAMFFNSNH